MLRRRRKPKPTLYAKIARNASEVDLPLFEINFRKCRGR